MYRVERDTMGEILVDERVHWGAQTQRSMENFPISCERMPAEIVEALAIVKEAAAGANHRLGKLSEEKCQSIQSICREIRQGLHGEEFPLKVWQTGSGTQSNMNMNEVIAHFAAERGCALHPNDHVNMSQSSNDTFPTAMHIAAVLGIRRNLLPAIEELLATFLRLEEENRDVVKIGRTHLQDATPIRLSQEISGWSEMLRESREMIQAALPFLCKIALGGTAVGTGLNAPEGFDETVAGEVAAITGCPFVTAPNKFHALTSKDAFVFAHGALSALAANMMKIANDVRWLASGPRCGIGELTIPANEPGSSIMPGKVNPTQCEAVTMAATQVLANHQAVVIAASQGNFQLNVYMPVCAHNFLQSVRLLGDSIRSFNQNCAVGIQANRGKIRENLERSLMLVTALNPHIGYDNAAKTAKLAFAESISLKEACEKLGFLTPEQFDAIVIPEQMTGKNT